MCKKEKEKKKAAAKSQIQHCFGGFSFNLWQDEDIP